VRSGVEQLNTQVRKIKNLFARQLRGITEDVFKQYERTLFAAGNSGVGDTVANSVALTAFTTKWDAPDGLFGYVGSGLRRGFRVEARGVYGTTTAGPTLRMLLVYNGGTILDTGTVTLNAVLTTNAAWALSGMVLQAADVGKIEAQGALVLDGRDVATSILGMPNTAEVASIITDGGSLEIQVIWGTANVSNTITLRTFVVTGLGTGME
jgi:hypothetical protein